MAISPRNSRSHFAALTHRKVGAFISRAWQMGGNFYNPIGKFADKLTWALYMSSVQERCQSFFNELAPRLDAAKMVKRELDRKLARRFNVFDYLRTDELGLSRMLADLLDPAGSHGQGPLFLNVFLKILSQRLDKPEERILGLDKNSVRDEKVTVKTEWQIEGGRRIDIVIEIGGKACLAIENKPYADDQDNQTRDYLDSLKKKYESSLLIYLSSQGRDPSERSIRPNELKCAKKEGRLIVLPYIILADNDDAVSADDKLAVTEDDGVKPQVGSLVDWLAECGRLCHVDRLRWVLQDAGTFVNRNFAGGVMASESEKEVTKKFVLGSEKNVSIVATLAESWPSVKNEICREFFERIVKETACQLSTKFPDIDTHVHCEENEKGNRVLLFRKKWRTCNNNKSGNTYGKKRYSICLEAGGKGPNRLYWGIYSPYDEKKPDEELQKHFCKLTDRLKEKVNQQSYKPNYWWPWYRYCEEYQDWHLIIPELYRENSESQGQITGYFVDLLTNYAKLAIPVIDEIERPD